MSEMKRTGPCLDENCSECCNPVKVRRFFPADKIPKDSEGKPLWKRRDELLLPEGDERTKLEAYDCENFDQATGRCKDYENRPEICRDSGCVDPQSDAPAQEQHKNLKEKKYIRIK